MSSAKLETPAPRGAWDTQRYRSCSERLTEASTKVARKRRWLMCRTPAAGTSAPLCRCAGVRWTGSGAPEKEGHDIALTRERGVVYVLAPFSCP